MKITIHSKEVDFSRALPKTIGDLRKLKAAKVIFPGEFDVRDPDQVISFIYHFANKANPDINEADVETLGLTPAMEIIRYLFEAKEDIEGPTLGQSTDSPTTTVGDQKI